MQETAKNNTDIVLLNNFEDNQFGKFAGLENHEFVYERDLQFFLQEKFL